MKKLLSIAANSRTLASVVFTVPFVVLSAAILLSNV